MSDVPQRFVRQVQQQDSVEDLTGEREHAVWAEGFLGFFLDMKSPVGNQYNALHYKLYSL